MSRYKAALSLYVAVAAHLLLILLVTLASGWNPRTPPPQLVAGSGQGLGGGEAPAALAGADAIRNDGRRDDAATRDAVPRDAAPRADDVLALASRPITWAPPPPPPRSRPAARPPAPSAPSPTPAPAPTPMPTTPPRPVRDVPTTPRADASAGASAGKTTSGIAAAPSSPLAGSGSAGGGRGGYAAEVRAHLSRYRRRLPGVLGTTARAEVSFSVDARGRSYDVALSQPSGIAALDAEALAMLQRATPLPAPPDGRPRRFTVPVEVDPPRLR